MTPIEPDLPQPVPVPSPVKKPRTPADLLRLFGMLLAFALVGWWMLQWLAVPRFQGDTLPTWRNRLNAPDVETRRKALTAFTRLPAGDVDTVTRLSERVLAEDDAETRRLALDTLAEILAPLTDLRRQALDGLLEVGREGSTVAALRAFDGVIEIVRASAGGPSGEVEFRQRVLALLLQRLEAEGTDRAALLDRLSRIPNLPGEAEGPLLAAWRTAENAEGRRRVVACLVTISPLSERALPALLDQLGDTELSGLIQARLLRIGPAATAGLIAVLSADDPRSSAAGEVLYQLGSAARPDLVRALSAGPVGQRIGAARILARQGDEGLALLLPGLASTEDGTVRAVREAFASARTNGRRFLLFHRQHPDSRIRAGIEALLAQLPEEATEKPK